MMGATFRNSQFKGTDELIFYFSILDWEVALGIPEVLEHILSFLALKNRQEVARFVCKQWYAACKNLIPTTHNWVLRLTPRSTIQDTNNDSDVDNKRDLIASAHTINLRVEKTGASYTERSHAWLGMMDTFSRIICKQDNRREHSRLRTLHLKEGVIWKFAEQIPLLPCLITVSTLRIDMIAKWDIIHLFAIFKVCPNLEELSIKPSLAAVKDSLRDSAVVHEQKVVLTSSQEYDLISGTNALPALTRLRTSIFYNMTITLPALTAFLQASPLLVKLILARCNHVVRQGQDVSLLDATQDHDHQDTSIIRLVGAHCPDLKTFHLSMSRDPWCGLGSQGVVALLETFSHMEACHLTDELFSPNLLMGLNTAGLTNRITTLNLLPTLHTSYQTPKIPLREILCSFEHLVHLRAPTAVYFVEDMDLHNVLDQLYASNPGKNDDLSRQYRHIPTNDPVAARQRVWACRGLKTLHMSIGNRVSRNSHSTEASLVIFGFLSRMAPRLQELYLKRYAITMTFEGGLALLTRIRDLERLRLVTVHCPLWMHSDLSWVDPNPPPKWERLMYPLLRPGQRKKLWEPYYGISRPEKATKGSMLVERGREFGIDLSRVGYPDDLLEWIDDRHSEEEQAPSWPKLESFWIEVLDGKSMSFFQKAEAFTRKVRPNVDAQFCQPQRDDFFLTTLQFY
ncbi:hypothetical protein BGZ97_012215 [Linnemannia gamsii]|uniref:F-box domain-containing protein n=1 Tax=Linnemannia gamsii TaxID=64522 RepID=A0A9P6RMH5_9FUNG|nr:hypothetical protein BGZ97_012215 [Linnemannia gamsii]